MQSHQSIILGEKLFGVIVCLQSATLTDADKIGAMSTMAFRWPRLNGFAMRRGDAILFYSECEHVGFAHASRLQSLMQEKLLLLLLLRL